MIQSLLMVVTEQMKLRAKFYVYAYLRADDSPYYIGKGKDDRAYNHGAHRCVNTPKNPSRIVKLAFTANEQDALQIEVLLISFYGRKDIGTGILRNMTNGGDGMSGIISSKETRRKISAAVKAHVRTAEHCRNISIGKKSRNLHLSSARKAQISAMFKNRKLSLITRLRISAAKLGKPALKTKGERNGRALLTLQDVRKIREGDSNEHEAKLRWGISRTQYYRVKRGEQWT